jgi:hypothetical protein
MKERFQWIRRVGLLSRMNTTNWGATSCHFIRLEIKIIYCLSVIACSRRHFIKTPWCKSASELYRPSDHRLSVKLVPNFADTGCDVVSVTHPYGHILGFVYRSSYFFFQVAPQLYSRGWIDPIPDPLLLRKSGSTGNRTRTSGSVARNSDH